MIVSKDSYTLFFGDGSTSFVKNSLHGYTQDHIMQLPAYKLFFDALNYTHLIILNQVHGSSGYSIHDHNAAQIMPYSIDGDYVITDIPSVALVVETADCVPLVLIDQVTPRVALVHAGWRGSAQGIIGKALGDMFNQGSAPEDIRAYLGPSAGGCCYEVSPDFINNFSHTKYTGYFIERNGSIFFDNRLFIEGELQKMGLSKENIVVDYAQCTVCSSRYCSYRRQSFLNVRQVTIVALKSIRL